MARIVIAEFDDPLGAVSGLRTVALEPLLADADVISLHVPLVESTRNLIDANRIAALRSGRLGGAAIDVFAVEPLPPSAHFADCPNLLLTPHVAGVTIESNQRVGCLIADKVLAALA